MHGLAGCYGECDRQLILKMLDRIRHRGPDASKVIGDDRAVVGSRALARRSGGRADCVAEEDGVVVTADAYIFNKPELLQEYFGPRARPDITDLELLVEMYRSAGLEMFGMIDGAYAIAVLEDSRLVLARDRLGIKPLYHSGSQKNGTYSSEMKSQLAAGPDFVSFPPGKIFVQEKGMKDIAPHMSRKPHGQERPDEAIRRLMHASTDRCIDNHESVNVLLDGGICTSAVAAAASLTTADVDTVCVGAAGGQELEIARKLSAALRTNHIEKSYEQDDLLQAVDEVVYALESFDYPLVRSSIPEFMASHQFLHRNRITLTGDGGDEVFGYYSLTKTAKTDAKLRRERIRLLESGSSTSYQRVDRMTASACLDGRMPILDGGVIETSLSLGYKDLMGTGPGTDKLILRRAFAKLLPKDMTFEMGGRLSEKSDPMRALHEYAEDSISDKEFVKERKALPKGRIRSKEELMYFRSFQKFFHSKSCYEAVSLTNTP